ncbi:hypothetical protein MLAC_20700 [Mycobacterium lacus]|uniref:Uncharacterized protein n=1 Tax=Mycobacterium lacus TaxID=169765 RepID=A0A7I7NJF2_9MYCO|nr:hypothetical protein MLAC_20700 [Mycobacterium lacus]
MAGTVGVAITGDVAGGAADDRGSEAACIAPSDNDCAPAAAGAPVIMPVVNDWPNDCGESGAEDAAAGGTAAGNDGPLMPTAVGAPGGDGGVTVPGDGGAGDAGWLLPNADAVDDLGVPPPGTDAPGAG